MTGVLHRGKKKTLPARVSTQTIATNSKMHKAPILLLPAAVEQHF